MSIEYTPTPLEQPAMTATARRGFTIGLPHCTDPSERRFPLTPEAVQILVERGYTVKIESQAADSIHYTDNQYLKTGAMITSRDEALRCDIVLHLAPLAPADIRRMRRGALLFTLLRLCRQTPESLNELLRCKIIAIAIDLIEDSYGNTSFADILSEIDGRASIATASSLLADSIHGKGILLGGVAGVVPCEVTVIGSGIAACAAARSAAGLGATVRMFDNDVYSLRRATRELGPWIVGSSLHPRVLRNALRTADVVIATNTSTPVEIDRDDVQVMKRGVVIFDLSSSAGVFKSLPAIDLADASAVNNGMNATTRVCYVNAGSAVPRTAAMALSDTFLTMLHKIVSCEGVNNALKLLPGLQRAVYTFLGKPVNPDIARIVGIRHVDISIYLTLS